MPEAFKDEFDVLKTCDTGSSLCVERFPSLFLSTSEPSSLAVIPYKQLVSRQEVPQQLG